MTATNHMLTGVIIGFSVTQPVMALPLALGSHFALDSLPHYGYADHTSKKFLLLLAFEALMLGVVSLFLFVTQPTGWRLAVACGLLASSPDFMWMPNFIRSMRDMPRKPYRGLHKFHKVIQWGESPRNWPIEIIWAVGAILLLANII